MTIGDFTILTALGSFLAGLVGSLTGLGGGVVIVPMLTLLFAVDMRYAIGASLVAVIATSSGAAAAYVKAGFSNIRIGMLLEIATTIGAIVGAFVTLMVPVSAVAIVFGVVLLVSALLTVRGHGEPTGAEPTDPLAVRFRLDSSYPTPEGPRPYRVQHVAAGFGLMFGAGVISGLLGIGSGALKVLAMDGAMRLPFKVSTTTSNFMIGVTGAASAGVYLNRGYIDPGISMPVVLGVLLGSMVGARILTVAHPRYLRPVFVLVLVALAVQMIYRGATGGFGS
jgi:uncharacterized protein